MADEQVYTACSFAPVQTTIEKSRKLRDLYGASQILSYLSQQVALEAQKTAEKIISPATIHIDKGMPNRILIKGKFSEKQARDALTNAWKLVLRECQTWVERNLPKELLSQDYCWNREWANWGNHAWEVFWGEGETIPKALQDLEIRKLSRAWTAINWVGESSSLTGTDGIAFPGIGAETRNPNTRRWGDEDTHIKAFYRSLACVLEYKSLDAEPEGKFVATNEKLSIPELVKRLVTRDNIAERLGMTPLEDSFSDIYRRPETITEEDKGRWTGWFMGDGDKVGEHLKYLSQLDNSDEAIHNFSQAMRNWGDDFTNNFFNFQKLGRVIYAGGDDFLGVIYSEKKQAPIHPQAALSWLIEFPKKWAEHGQLKADGEILGVSVGFIWAAHSVPQRDVLQHCREAEKVAKSLGRNRVTIRVLFNSGQYVEWTCPWDKLGILREYRDRYYKTYAKWQESNFAPEHQPNWSHIYTDLSQLSARHAFKLDRDTFDTEFAIQFLSIYFPEIENQLLDYDTTQHLVGFSDDADGFERAQATVEWICNLIQVGWHLCSNNQ
jgi:CRISPR-associated protein Cmr2